MVLILLIYQKILHISVCVTDVILKLGSSSFLASLLGANILCNDVIHKSQMSIRLDCYFVV